MDRKQRKRDRQSGKLDAKLRLLSGANLPGRDRDAEPPRMLQPGTRGEVTTVRDDLMGDASSTSGSPLLIAEDGRGGVRSRSTPWASYGVLRFGGARPLRVERGPVSMLSRRHDRPLLRDRRHDRVTRNRAIFFLLVCAIVALLLYSFL